MEGEREREGGAGVETRYTIREGIQYNKTYNTLYMQYGARQSTCKEEVGTGVVFH